MADPVLALDGITKRFGALTASDGVSMALLPGEIHALIGPNGAGKSTLIKQISGELAPDTGTITFNGQSLAGMDTAARARAGLARTFQISSVMPEFSVLKNVMLACQGRQQSNFSFWRAALGDRTLTEPALAAIARTGLEARADIPASDLSHGERRMLEIAMALAMGPKAFILDEPMAGMGPEGSKALTAILHDLKHEAPILLVEHDMDAVFALADRISVLVYGRIIATGSVDEIRANTDVRQAYLGEEAAA